MNGSYPSLLPMFMQLNAVQQSDLARLLYLHHWGGVYADLDVALLQPLAPLLAAQRGVGALLGQARCFGLVTSPDACRRLRVM